MTNPVRDFLEPPEIVHRAAVFYQVYQTKHKYVKIIKQRDLEYELGKEEWRRLIANQREVYPI